MSRIDAIRARLSVTDPIHGDESDEGYLLRELDKANRQLSDASPKSHAVVESMREQEAEWERRQAEKVGA